LITALAVRVQGLEHRLSPAPLRREDRAALEHILPAIAGAVGSECFLAAEVIASEHAALRLVLDGLSGRQLGRLLRRGERYP
jgi:hypothetical protein